MKNIHNCWKALGVISLLAVGLALTGCQSSGGRSMAQKWADSDVARNVKSELNQDPMYKYTDVQAVVHDGVVQLSGFVDTPEQRERAAQIAANAKGATQIINTIVLKPTPTGPAPIKTNAPAAGAPASEQPAPPSSESPGQQPKSN